VGTCCNWGLHIILKSADVFDSSIGTDQWEWARYDKILKEYLKHMHAVVASRCLGYHGVLDDEERTRRRNGL
jgi:hypothetical protein